MAAQLANTERRERRESGERKKRKREPEKERLVEFFHGSQHSGKTQMMSIIRTLSRACVPGCVVCTGREAANECSVALLLSHSERPEYMEAVEMANTAHQISSAAALVSPVRERERAIRGRHACLFTSWNAHSVQLFVLHRHSRLITIFTRLALPLFFLPADNLSGLLALCTLY